MSSRPHLSLIVPTYNERDRLAELTAAVFEVSHAVNLDLELVIVDDNSPDGTGELADQLARHYRMQVVHRQGKLGLGTAVVAGFAVATSDILGVMDADFSHPPALVPKMLSALYGTDADVVVASRYIPGGRTTNWPLKRRVLSRLGCFLARGLSPIRDAASGFFLIRADVARGVPIKAGGFKICLELIVRAMPSRLVELPYQFDDRELGESKMSLKEASGYLVQLRDLYRLKFTSRRRKRQTYRRLSLADVERIHEYGA